ncbi:MAG: recombination regulator RecX [Sedimenticola sp.]|nr:recombination regulator RecX [Sedimenticola sp.]
MLNDASVSERNELEQAAIRLLANREHSRSELSRKLSARCVESDLLEQVLDWLESCGYQSDERFTELYIKQRKQKGFGPVRIRLELQERGISAALIEHWLDAEDTEWLELLGVCCKQKFGCSPPDDFKAQTKRARFLEYRGFPTEMIRSYIWRDT